MSGTTTDAPRRGWAAFQPWAPDAALGVLVLLAGLIEQGDLYMADFWDRANLIVLAFAIALAVGLARRAPGFSLLLVWFVCSMQVIYSVPLLFTEAAIVVVAFGTARWGSHATVVLSGLSIPAAGAIAVYFLRERGFASIFDFVRYRPVYDAAERLADTWQVGAGILAMAVLTVPWMTGLVLRYGNRAAASRQSQAVAEQQAERAVQETHQAQEIARLREEQTQLARDVHDVVGHSLAVILAQAESAQYLDDADTGALRLSMEKIADSARSSLQDVRQVLTSTQEPATAGPGELDDLVEGVRASGHEIRFDVVGTARPLAPELATVAYRVLQEMLTNAIRHGRRDSPVDVELHWSGELRIEVVNVVDTSTVDQESGHGLEGMLRRLESVGGRLDIRRRDLLDAQTFTATAWVPMRTVYP